MSMTTEQIQPRIQSIKQRVEQAKRLPALQMMQKAAIVETVVTDAVFVIEQMAEEQQRLEKMLDDLLTNGPQQVA